MSDLYEDRATWHIRHDPDGDGPLCYAATPDRAAEHQAAGYTTHPADQCPATLPVDPYGTQPMNLEGLTQ